MAKNTVPTQYTIQEVLNLVYDAVARTLAVTLDGVTPDDDGNIPVIDGGLRAGEFINDNVQAVAEYPVLNAAFALVPYIEENLTTGIIKNTRGNLYRIRVTNANAAVRYLLFYNQLSGAASGTTNLLIAKGVQIPASGTLDLILKFPLYFSTGIAFGISTAANTYTAATASEHTVLAEFI